MTQMKNNFFAIILSNIITSIEKYLPIMNRGLKCENYYYSDNIRKAWTHRGRESIRRHGYKSSSPLSIMIDQGVGTNSTAFYNIHLQSDSTNGFHYFSDRHVQFNGGTYASGCSRRYIIIQGNILFRILHVFWIKLAIFFMVLQIIIHHTLFELSVFSCIQMKK